VRLWEYRLFWRRQTVDHGLITTGSALKLGIAKVIYFRDNLLSERNHAGGYVAASTIALYKPLTDSYRVGGFDFGRESVTE